MCFKVKSQNIGFIAFEKYLEKVGEMRRMEGVLHLNRYISVYAES